VAFAVFCVLLLATGLMRLIELSVSRHRLRQSPSRTAVPEPWLFPLMVALHTGLVCAPIVEVVAFERPFIPALSATAAVLLAVATALRVWVHRTLREAFNVRVVEPRAIVTGGPYRFVRHPNYLAVILEIACLPLLYTAWLSSLALSSLNAFVLYHRIRVEERVLGQIPAWREAMDGRARLVPGLF